MAILSTRDDFERATERLRCRDAESLVMFLMSLAGHPGPIGEQVRTFIVGNDVAETVESLQQRISGLAIASEYEHRHSLGREMGTNLELILDSVESLVLPRNPRAAFELLGALFEAGAIAMENCGEHDWEVTCAYQRAAGVMADAAKQLPSAEIFDRIRALMCDDGYGLRTALASVLLEDRPHG